MKTTHTLLIYALITTPMAIVAEGEKTVPQTNQTVSKEATKTFEPFTGKVTRNKVRLRLQPNTDAYVLKELNQNDLLVITGQSDDFYAVQPPKDSKGYIFRTYVLDNVVEGNRVNVRLKADLDSPIITQMSSGDKVSGNIDAANPKWLEISLPPSTQFYIAKDYVQKVGDVNYLSRMEKRREESDRLLNTSYAISINEMNKPFEEIHIDGIVANYKKVINDYSDIPENASRADVLLSDLQKSYTNKRIAYLETQSQKNTKDLEIQNKTLAEKLENYQRLISQLEQEASATRKTVSKPISADRLPLNMSQWIPVEQALVAKWTAETLGTDSNQFYTEQEKTACIFKGQIEPYNRPVKNRPGDYMLVNSHSKLPIAFLYSTHVNLQDYVGHDVVIHAAPRPNNNYAFPAYFVLSIE